MTSSVVATTTLEPKSRHSLHAAKSVGLAALVSFPIAAVASITWLVLILASSRLLPSIPWAPVAMGFFLVLYWWYLRGGGWPARTAAERSRLLRARMVPARVFTWALLAGGLGLVSLAGIWVVLVRVTGVGGNPTSAPFDGYPLYIVAPTVVIASLVSPLSEEAAFRGYAQVVLERSFRPLYAVAISSAFFALWHGPTQGFFWSKLVFFFAVGVLFGTIAYATKSTLPALPVHIAGDLLFFLVIWPNDSARTLVLSHGTDIWFWLNVAQALLFGIATIWAVRRLAGLRSAIAA